MLQSMRDNLKGTIAIIIVGFLGLIMALSLVNLDAIGGHSAAYGEVARVNGREITEQDLRLALGQEAQRLQAQFGDNLPAEFLSEERLRGPVLDSLVQRNVLLDKALSTKMTASDAHLDTLITELPNFQTDGVFNPELFVQGVRGIGHTPISYRSLVRDDIVVNQLRNALAGSSFVTEDDVKNAVALSRQTRDFSWVSIPLADLPEKMQVSSEEVANYYDENKNNYLTEEKVAVEYIELQVDDFAGDIDVSEEEIARQYQQELNASSVAASEREAAHILIEGDDQEAQQKITTVKQKLAAGEDFAALAQEFSDDFGSKDNGGVLGFTSGDAFPDDFEDALAGLEVNQVSEPVEIDGATHFIKLLSIKENTLPTLDERRDEIKQQLVSLQAEEIFIEKITALKDLAYNAENLSEVADQLSLSVQTTALFTRAGGSEAVLSDGRVVEAAFSDQVLQQGFTSEVLELAADRAVVVNLTQHEPVRTLTLAEKQNDITSELKLSKAKEALTKQAESLKADLATGESLESLAEKNALTLNSETNVNRESGALPGELLDYIFSLSRPQSGKAVSSSFYLDNNDYALVSLSAVNDADFDALTEEEKRSARLSLARTLSIDEFRAWQAVLLDQADIEIIGRQYN